MASLFSIFLSLLAVSGSVIGSTKAEVPHPGYTGGLQDIDVNHHTVQFLIKSLPLLSKSFETLEVINVVRAQVQVVSGLKYVLTVQTREKGTNGPADQECKISIWIQSWLERRTLTEEKCESITKTYGMVGSWSEANVTNTVRQLANVGLELINSRCNCMFRRTITKIKKVQQKVVAGMMYKITIETVETICRNIPTNKGKSLEECPGSTEAVPQECDITMIHQPWMNPSMRLFKHTCH